MLNGPQTFGTTGWTVYLCFGIQYSTPLLPSVNTTAQDMYNSVASRLQALVYSIFPPKEERCQNVVHGACGQYHENSILLWSFLLPVLLYVISKANVTDSVRLTTQCVAISIKGPSCHDHFCYQYHRVPLVKLMLETCHRHTVLG